MRASFLCYLTYPLFDFVFFSIGVVDYGLVKKEVAAQLAVVLAYFSQPSDDHVSLFLIY